MKAPIQTEASFQAQVVRLATLNGWHTYHTHDSRRSAPGYPDIHAWGHGRSLFAELKSEKGHLSLDQRRVIAQMRHAGLTVHVWRPSDWLEIVATLTRPKHPSTLKSDLRRSRTKMRPTESSGDTSPQRGASSEER